MTVMAGNEGAGSLNQAFALFDPSIVGESEHFVQFYEREASLLDGVTAFLLAGLRQGESCVVIATEVHRTAVQERVQASGVDLLEAQMQGRYLGLDAVQTLSQFMVDGLPDPARFMDVIGGVFRSRPLGRPIRAFGEMVAILWAQGHHTAATRLEELWNNLGRHLTFSLFCAYPLTAFHREAHATAFLDICGKHGRVVPGESFPQPVTVDAAARVIAELQQKSLALETEVEARRAAEREIQLLNEQLTRKVDEYARAVRALEVSRAELQEKISDLERFEDAVVGRELKMIEMEKELNRLRQRLGIAASQ